MTVVSFLRLNPVSGMACADESETHRVGVSERTYSLKKKLYNPSDLTFVGASGYVSYAVEIIGRADKEISSDADIDQVKRVLKKKYREVKDEKIQEHLLNRFNITFDDVKKNKEINPEIVKKAIEMLNDPSSFEITFLLGGYNRDEGKFQTYLISYPGGSLLIDNYYSMGTGSDIADAVIGDYIRIMDPDQRENIQPYKGAKILMEATRSSWKNTGVGGKSQLIWTRKDNKKEIGWRESDILNNLLYLKEKEKVPEAFVNDMFHGVIEKGEDYQACMEEIGKRVTKRDLLKLSMAEGLLL